MRLNVVIMRRLFKCPPHYGRIFTSKVVHDLPFFPGSFTEHPIKPTVPERTLLCQLGAAGFREVNYCQSTFCLFLSLIGWSLCLSFGVSPVVFPHYTLTWRVTEVPAMDHFKTVKMSTHWFGVYLGLALCWTPRGREVRVLLMHPHATCDLAGAQLTTLVRISGVHTLRVTCLSGERRSPLLESTRGEVWSNSPWMGIWGDQPEPFSPKKKAQAQVWSKNCWIPHATDVFADVPVHLGCF